MAHFEIENLTFAYPDAAKNALSGIDLKIERGEYIVLCGASGSGKTTLMRHLKSVLTPHGTRSGRILFEDRPLEEVSLRDQSSRIGFVMQNPDNQIVTDKVWHELAFGLESLGCDQKTMRIRVAEMASYFGIQGWFHRDVAELSGGQKQLLNLASIMAMQPSVLILDEPTSQLDPIAASDFLNTVRKINRELGTTVILSEHRLEEVFPSSDRVVVLEGGRIIAADTPSEIGRILSGMNHVMTAGLPSPMRIYQGVGDLSKPSPLTVREGRKWLDDELKNVDLKVTKLEDAKEYEEPEPEDAAVTLKEVWFRYEKDSPDVLKGVNLSVPRGSIFAVVGGNGTGKSTMMKTICGILKPYRGKVLINGRKIGSYKSSELFRDNLAMLPQDPQSLFVKKTVEEDLLEMLEGISGTDEEKEALVNEVVEECEITDFLRSHPYDLSGGEQQRAALAKVLLCRPKILLLDEPTKGIDNFYKRKLSGILGRMRSKGRTVIIVTHDVEFCAETADSVSMFFDGSVMTTDTPPRFFAKNSFYTTSANRMSRHVFSNAVTVEDVVKLCKLNMGSGTGRGMS
ncbi:MAG: ABC transporter ATP-binding protein [Eubacterium sp.]|jgi:energy-coupling factor transporter ATP-binding protein EcfA2